MSKHNHISNSGDGSNVLVDRISALNDNIFSEILSLLPTKDAVSTSCLAKRWELLWTTVANLDFEFNFDPEGSVAISNTFRESFMHFVNRVVLLHNQPLIHKFRFKFKCPHLLFDYRYASLWVSFALSRRTRELDFSVISTYSRHQHKLPRALFDSTTLVVLKLKGDFTITISESSTGMPNLKILHVSGVCFGDVESVNNLLAHSQILEDVVLNTISIDAFEEKTGLLTIACPHLKKLDFHNDSFGTIDLEINLPALECLRLFYECSPHIVFKNLSSLVEATLDLDIAHYQEEGDADDYSSAVNKILEGIYNVKFLYLSKQTMEALVCADFNNHKFPNLRRLKVGSTINDLNQ